MTPHEIASGQRTGEECETQIVVDLCPCDYLILGAVGRADRATRESVLPSNAGLLRVGFDHDSASAGGFAPHQLEAGL